MELVVLRVTPYRLHVPFHRLLWVVFQLVTIPHVVVALRVGLSEADAMLETLNRVIDQLLLTEHHSVLFHGARVVRIQFGEVVVVLESLLVRLAVAGHHQHRPHIV